MWRIDYVSEKPDGTWSTMWNEWMGMEKGCREVFRSLNHLDPGRGYFLLDQHGNVVEKKLNPLK